MVTSVEAALNSNLSADNDSVVPSVLINTYLSSS
jgi:hypothetical protein